MEIIPGILEKDWSKIEQKINLLRPFAKTLHIDLIDGKFLNNSTFSNPQPFKKFSEDFFLELHMMVENPIFYIEEFAAAGFKRFIGQVEKMTSQIEFVAKAQIFGEVGLALDGPTPLVKIEIDYDQLDSVLVYTAEKVGFSGAALKKSRLAKIKQIRKVSSIPIEVDGGINDQTILLAQKAGATQFVTSSYLFESKNPQAQYDKLLKIISQTS